jgi:SOS response regulatory protein OraA/RecX
MTRSYTVFFRDSEECLRCLSRRAASESEVREWFTSVGIDVVAITAEARLTALA